MDFKIYSTVPGKHSIVDVVTLRYKNILKVKREGRGFDIIRSATFFPVTPPDGSRVVSYNPQFGELIFSNDEVFAPGETVYVLYD